MKISFDAAKHQKNLRERGFGFDYAALIFDGPVIEWPDLRRDYGEEERIIALGAVGKDVLVVVYTDRNDSRRIISARLANAKERTCGDHTHDAEHDQGEAAKGEPPKNGGHR